MEIQSAYNTGLQSFKNATESADKAAADIAASTSFQRQNKIEQLDTSTTTTEVGIEVSNQLANRNNVPNLNQSVVDLKVAEFQAKAATQVIRSADDSLGTLIDITA